MDHSKKTFFARPFLTNIRGRFERNGTALLRAIKTAPRKFTWSKLCALVWLGAYAGLAAAQVSDGSAPWDSSLCGVAGWFKGPTMIAIGSIAFGAAGAGFMFGEELTGILKKVVNIVMGVCLAVSGTAILGWIAVKAGATKSVCT